MSFEDMCHDCSHPWHGLPCRRKDQRYDSFLGQNTTTDCDCPSSFKPLDLIEADGNKPISSVNVCGVCGMLTKYRGMEICSVCNKTDRIGTEKRWM